MCVCPVPAKGLEMIKIGTMADQAVVAQARQTQAAMCGEWRKKSLYRGKV